MFGVADTWHSKWLLLSNVALKLASSVLLQWLSFADRERLNYGRAEGTLEQWFVDCQATLKCVMSIMLHSIQLVNSWSGDDNHEFTTCEWNAHFFAAIFNHKVENSCCTNLTWVHRLRGSRGQWNAMSLLVNS